MIFIAKIGKIDKNEILASTSILKICGFGNDSTISELDTDLGQYWSSAYLYAVVTISDKLQYLTSIEQIRITKKKKKKEKRNKEIKKEIYDVDCFSRAIRYEYIKSFWYLVVLYTSQWLEVV